MKHLILITMLIPTLAFADAIPTRSVNPVIRISGDTLYLSDKKGSNWAVETQCEIEPEEITEFTVPARVIKAGNTIRFNERKTCKIESVKLV